ncbi:hypothetical protein [Kitasatospora sp. NPDC093558]|uniref:hypothetical protein n=1 Tax=Kitasatospora sp. NPDC093558 TaxID=3155201 RepID=UPI00343F5AD7
MARGATGRLERSNQAAQLIPPYPGHEYDVSFLKHEFFFERIVDARSAGVAMAPFGPR